jgi:hypothetical protein
MLAEKSCKMEAASVLDPLRLTVDLPFHERLYPRGFPVGLATNSRLVAEAARESWRSFPQAFDAPDIQLRVAVDGEDTSPLAPEPVFRSQKQLLAIVANSANFAFCDLAGAFAFCWVNAATAAHEEYLRYHFLDSMVLTILEHLRLTSVHAACVALNGRGVLLFGESGAGKSCLAFACARRGWALIGDDAGSLVRGRSDNIVLGDPTHLRFRESAVELFPELGNLPLSTTRGGEPSIQVLTRDLPEIATALRSPVERVVFLERRARGGARLIPLKKSEAFGRLASELPLYDAAVHEEHKTSLANLLRAGACELQYGDLDSAVERLGELVS